MRRRLLTALCGLVAVAASVAPGASAQTFDEQLDEARTNEDAALGSQRAAERTLADVLAEFERVRSELDLAVRDVMIASQAERDLDADLDQAQLLLDRRASTAYQLGPALALELFLGSRTPGDFASVQEFLGRTLVADDAAIADVDSARHSLTRLSEALAGQRADLAATEVRLRLLAAEAAARIEASRADAEAASAEVARLEKEQAAAAASLSRLIDATRGFDQSELLALLGPNEGRGCAIPDGLEDTGQRVDGLSSWYGWDFAGQHTASGAIFDPTLFTVANKELPLNVFLRIHYKGGCAITLLNDRGPYGYGRVFDVSEAVADYLGYLSRGVAWVEADVLVPA